MHRAHGVNYDQILKDKSIPDQKNTDSWKDNR